MSVCARVCWHVCVCDINAQVCTRVHVHVCVSQHLRGHRPVTSCSGLDNGTLSSSFVPSPLRGFVLEEFAALKVAVRPVKSSQEPALCPLPAGAALLAGGEVGMCQSPTPSCRWADGPWARRGGGRPDSPSLASHAGSLAACCPQPGDTPFRGGATVATIGR